MLTGKKAVIFDLDGTLIDSMSMWDDINVEYLSKFGLTVPENLQREISGMSFTECAIYFKEKFHLEAFSTSPTNPLANNIAPSIAESNGNV